MALSGHPSVHMTRTGQLCRLMTHSGHCARRPQRSRLMHGPTLLGLMPSSHSVIAEYVCFDFQLSKTVLENITNADDPHELIAVLDRHMANTPHGHQLHDVSHAVLR